MIDELELGNLSEKKLKELKERIEAALIEKTEQALKEKWTDEIEIKKYKSTINSSLKQLRTHGIIAADPGGQNVEPALENIFIELYVRKDELLNEPFLELEKSKERELRIHEKKIYFTDGLSPEEVLKNYKEKYFRAREKVDPVSIYSALQNDKVILLGDPGSGKTTFIKHLAYLLSKENYARTPQFKGKIPILIYLRDCNELFTEQLCLSTEDFFKEILDKSLVHFFSKSPLNSKILYNYYKKGNVVLLFDGLDEVGNKDTRKNVSRCLHDILSSSSCPVIITSRPVGYFQNPINRIDIAHFTILGFNDKQKSDFITKWYITTETQTENNQNTLQRGQELAKSLIDGLEKDEALNSLAENPLLITFMVFLHHHLAKMPDKRYQLYEEYIKVALSRWDRAKGLSPLTDPDKKNKVLEPLAYYMHLNKKRDVTIKEIESYVGMYLSSVGVKNTMEFFNELFERNIIIIERGALIYSFLHLSFQEYLCAKYLASRNDAYKILLANLNDPWWNNTKHLYSAINDTTQVVTKILKRDETEIEKYLYKNIFDASEFLVETNSISEQTRNKVVNRLLDIFIYEQGSWLRAAARTQLIELMANSLFKGDIETKVISLLDNNDYYLRSRAAIILGATKSEKAVESLLPLLNDPNDEVKRRTIAALGSIGSEKAILHLIESLSTSSGEIKEIILWELGKFETKEVESALLKCLGDQNSNVRTTAVYTLYGFKTNEVLTSLLKIINDPDERVVSAAIGFLIDWNTKEIVDIIIDLIKNSNSTIKEAIADSLGSLNFPNIENALKMLSNDSNLEVSNSAIYSLIEYYTRNGDEQFQVVKLNIKPEHESYAIHSLSSLYAKREEQYILSLLNSDQHLVKCAAIVTIGEQKIKNAENLLIALLHDEQENVRLYSLIALANLKSNTAEIVIGTKLIKDSSPIIRRSVIYYLAQIKSKLFLAIYKTYLKDSSTMVVVSTINAIAEMKIIEAEESLINLLSETDVDIKVSAINALGSIKSEKAVSRLIDLLEDENDEIKKSAANALLTLDSQETVHELFKGTKLARQLSQEPSLVEKVLLIKYKILDKDYI